MELKLKRISAGYYEIDTEKITYQIISRPDCNGSNISQMVWEIFLFHRSTGELDSSDLCYSYKAAKLHLAELINNLEK